MGYEAGVEDVVRLFLRRLEEEFIKPGRPCEMHKWLQWYAYDVIGEVTMSQPMGLLEQGKDVDGMLWDLKVETDYRALAAQMPWMDYVLRKNPVLSRLRAPTHKIMIRAKAMLDYRLSHPGKEAEGRTDFISRFVEAKNKHPETLTDRNMLGFVGSNLQAGSDTTAIALRTIVYYAVKTPGIIDTLRKEIDKSEVQHPIPFQHAFNNMAYVDAVIREALRIHPPFAMLLERVVPHGGLELPDGRKLPEGTKVGAFGYTIHRDPEIFGADVDSFNPDRWLQHLGESDDDFGARVKAMKALDLSFGIGSRACLGRHVAELQMYKLVPAVFGLLEVSVAIPNLAADD